MSIGQDPEPSVDVDGLVMEVLYEEYPLLKQHHRVKVIAAAFQT
jgi:hypothetical protein